MTKLKKVVAGILAAAAMATSVVGMSASAYSPTVSRTVGSVTGTLYSDTTYGYGTTACSNQTCYVKVKHGGTTSMHNHGTEQRQHHHSVFISKKPVY